MRFVGLASLVLATVLGASNASAGFLTIDEFGTSEPSTGMFLSRTPGTYGTLTALANSLQVDSDVVAPGVNVAQVDYVIGGKSFESYRNTLVWKNLSNTTVTAQVSVNGGAFENGSIVGTDMVFANLTGDFSNVTTLSFTFTSGNAFSFTSSSLQAVPEPTTLALIGLVGAGGGVAGWRRRRAAKA